MNNFIQFVLWHGKSSEHHSREGFLRIASTIPIFKEDEVIHPSMMSILMGISSQQYPANNQNGIIPEDMDDFNQNQMVRTYLTTGRISTTEWYRLNYKSTYVIRLYLGKQPLKKMEWQAIQNWEDFFIKPDERMAHVPEAFRKALCTKMVQVSQYHDC